jgi:putative membrane protein
MTPMPDCSILRPLRDPIFLAALCGAGIALPLLPWTRPQPGSLTPFLLLLCALLVLTGLIAKRPMRLLVFFAVTYVLTFAAEVCGAATGIIFGYYRYGRGLGFKLLDVPLVIGLAWCLVVLGCVRLSLYLFRGRPHSGRLLTLLAAPLGCVIFDIFLEPKAGALGYWTWRDGGAPVQNYLAWGVIAFLVTGVYLLLDTPSDSIVPVATSGSQFALFGILLLVFILTGGIHV